MKTKGRECEFCGAFMVQGDRPWKLNLVFGDVPARFEGRKQAPDICGECVAKLLGVLRARVDPQANADGEVQALVIQRY